MAKKKMLAEQQGTITAPRQIESWTQGAAQLAQAFVNARQQAAAETEEATGRQELAGAMAGIDWDAGPTAEQQAIIYGRDPELGMKVIADMVQARRNQVSTLTPEEEIATFGADKPGTYQKKGTGEVTRIDEPEAAETYGPVVTGEQAKTLGLDPTKSYQLNQKTQQYDQIGGGGTSVTINPPSAETSAKLGLAKGFIDNYDSILKSVDAGEMTGPGYLKGVTLGYGNGGTQYRNLLQGTEAMVRLLTGAGMNESEARQRVTQYEPAATDDAVTLRSKIEGLKQALDNVIEGVETRGQPGATDGEDTTPPPADDATAPTLDPNNQKAYDDLDDGAPYKVPGDPKVYHKNTDDELSPEELAAKKKAGG